MKVYSVSKTKKCTLKSALSILLAPVFSFKKTISLSASPIDYFGFSQETIIFLAS